MARSILADIDTYHLNSLNGKINGSKRENIHGSAVRTQTTKAVVKGLPLASPFLEGVPTIACEAQTIPTMVPVTFQARFWFLEYIPHSSQSALLIYFILFEKELS